jgi:hypothetical protein
MFLGVQLKKIILYTFLTILILQFILINCARITKFNNFFVAMCHFDQPFQKIKSNSFNTSQIKVFATNMVPRKYLPLADIDMVQEHTFEQRVWDNCSAIGEYLGCTFVNASWVQVTPPHYLNRMSIPNFVHHHFWPRLLQDLGYLLQLILEKLIN